MNIYQSYRILLLLWQFGLVDTLTVVQFATNLSCQYVSIVIGSASGNFSTIEPKILLEPVLGFVVSGRYVIAAQTTLERRALVATLAAFLSSSTGAALTCDPATNGALGGAIGSKIAMMRAILARVGGQARALIISYYLL